MKATRYYINSNIPPNLVKLPLEAPPIDEDWIADNLDFEAIQEMVILTFNERKGVASYRHLPKIKKHTLRKCEIIEKEDEVQVYQLPSGVLQVDLLFEAYLTTITISYKKGICKFSTKKKYHSYIQIEVLVKAKTILELLIKGIRLTSKIA